MLKNKDIFLDCNASHPLLPFVRQELIQALSGSGVLELSNPMSIHARGRASKRNLFELKEALCQYFGAKDVEEFVLNSGATEGLNTVIRAFVRERREAGRVPVVLYSSLEHSAVRDTLEDIAELETYEIPVDASAQLNEAELFKVFRSCLEQDNKDILLVLQLANNELGTCFDFSFQQRLHAEFGPKLLNKLPKIKGGKYPKTPQRFWTFLDAAQAFGKMPEAFIRRCAHYADYLAITAHKIGGPTGIGALWLNGKVPYKSHQTGGAQEKKRRAGTHNTLGILGFKFALLDWMKNGEGYRQKMTRQRDQIFSELKEKITGLHFHPEDLNLKLTRICNTLNFHVEGCNEESLLVGLDLEGVCVASGSACNSGSIKPSKVLLALGISEERAVSSLRVSLGVESTDEEIEEFLKIFQRVVLRIRAANELSEQLLPKIELSSPVDIG